MPTKYKRIIAYAVITVFCLMALPMLLIGAVPVWYIGSVVVLGVCALMAREWLKENSSGEIE